MSYVRDQLPALGQESPVIPGAPSAVLPTTETDPWKTLLVVGGVGVLLWWLLGAAMQTGPRPRVGL